MKIISSRVVTVLVILQMIFVPPSVANDQPSAGFPFRDIKGHWAEAEIVEMYARDVIKGYGDSTFKPRQPVTFLEAIVMLDRLLGYEPSDTDIDESSISGMFNIPKWAAGYVGLALRNELLQYSELQKLSLQQPLIRQDGAVLAVRALGLTKQAKRMRDAVPPFNDVSQVDQVAKASISIAVERKIMNGYPNGIFQPSSPVSRAEIAVLLSNINEQIPFDDSGQVSGLIKSVDRQKIVISAIYGDGKDTEFSLPAQYISYLNNKPAAVDEMAGGNFIRIISSNSLGLTVIIAQAVIPDLIGVEQVDPAMEPDDIREWVEKSKASENYLFNKAGNQLYLLAARGEKMTSGFNVDITKVSRTVDEEGVHYRVWIDLTDPDRNTVVIPVITYPFTLVRVELLQGAPGTITFVDKLNQILAETKI